MSTAYKTVPLFGGAITVDLPSKFHDASLIRQIPDNQELYLDRDGYASILVDILEHVHKPSDEEALQYHFQDLVEGTGDSTNVLKQGRGAMDRMPDKPLQLLHFVQTPAPPAPGSRPKKEPEYVAIHLLLLRLKDQDTDIVITVNEPHYANEYEKAASASEPTPLMKEGEEIAKKILETFKIREWGLFDGQ